MFDVVNLHELETKGFVVIKNFLNDQAVQKLLCDYREQLKNNNCIGFRQYYLLKSSEHRLTDKIKIIVDQINTQTDISIDFVSPQGLYFDNSLAEVGWHQDHESYYVWQTGYHQVNCWIPLIKSDKNQSGIKVVPMNKLKIQIGKQFEQFILDQGAKRFVTSDNITHVFDDEQGTEFDLPVDLDTLAESPHLQPGDVLLIRGDVIHATQDANTHRVSLSIRTVDGSRTIQREKFFHQCEMKKFVLDANYHTTKRIINQFKSDKDELIIHDLFRGRI